MNYGYKFIDKLIKNPSKSNLILLNKVLSFGIPFNAPHSFGIQKLSSEEIVIKLPNKKLNHNHLKGVHACAIATVGEFCAGLAILSSFGISKYRLILSELNAKYCYQGRTNLIGTCLPSQINELEVQKSLEEKGTFFQTLKTIIKEEKTGKEVAEVTTTWQLKPWDKVKTKH
jgi:acyl-coenzyme A thioesterase PaaI-like protein